MSATQKKLDIVSLNKKADYLEARKLVAAIGRKLPSNVLHDDHLVRTDEWKKNEDLYPAWARELIVRDMIGGLGGFGFRKGKDVIDQITGWIYPASYIPAEAIGIKGASLFVDPADITTENGKVIVHPASVKILLDLVAGEGPGGKVDPITRMPVYEERGTLITLPVSERRFFQTVKNYQMVEPIFRLSCQRDTIWGESVLGYFNPPKSDKLGVAIEAPMD